MRREKIRSVSAAIGLLAAFALWTAAVLLVDVRAIGPLGSQVGLAALNSFVHEWTGVHMGLYVLTDWLGLVPVGIGAGFALLGLRQWVARRKLRKVDRSLLVLGAFYIVVLGAYVFFESAVVNYRPVLIEGILEASYPSSTTMLVLCVLPTASMQLCGRIKSRALGRLVSAAAAAFSALMVAGRLLSGVHWCSDIIGGVLLSAGLVLLYRAAVLPKEK